MRIALFLAAALGVAGCGTPEEAAERDTARQIAACTGYGFQAGTPQMAQCMQTEAISARQVAEARRQRALANLDAMSQPQFPRRTNCSQWGQTMNCTTY